MNFRIRCRFPNFWSASCPLARSAWGPLLVMLIVLSTPCAGATERKTRNVILITMDGFRWQEVFTGAEDLLLSSDHGGVKSPEALRREFWRDTPEERRKLLLPFLWTTVARDGQIWGNRALNSSVRVANAVHSTYPGFNEMITGYPDPRIYRNDRELLNPNITVFEWLNQREPFRGKVRALGNWALFAWIINSPRCGFPIWTGAPLPAGSQEIPLPDDFRFLVERSTTVWAHIPNKPNVLGAFLAYAAKEVLQTDKPRVLWISYADTDNWAHEGRYDRVLWSARECDRMISDLWTLVQSMPEYRDQTTLIISPDHGRGIGPVEWKSHGKKYAHSDETWFAVIGPDTLPLGERRDTPAATQSQIAATIAALVGEDFPAALPHAAPAWPEIIAPGP